MQLEHQFSADHARVSWVRSAYIVAFAAFGWRYILQTSFNPIRAQLRNPEEISLPTLGFHEPGAKVGRRELLIVEDPQDCQCVTVRMDQHTVFLPAIDSTRPLDALVASILNHQPPEDGRFVMSGQLVPWPSKPGYPLDPVAT